MAAQERTYGAFGTKGDSSRCCEEVPDGGRSVNFHQCGNRWVVERDGQRYCRAHDPIAVAERNRAADAKYKADEEAARQRKQDQLVAKSTRILSALGLEPTVERIELVRKEL